MLWDRCKGKGRLTDRTTFACAQLVLLIIFLSYTSTSTVIFQALRKCDELDEAYHGSSKYMHDDYSTSCKTPEYTFIRVWGVLMLFVYCLGVPLVSFAALWAHRHTLNPAANVFGDPEAESLIAGGFDPLGAFRSMHVKRQGDERGSAIKAQSEEAVFSWRGGVRPDLLLFLYDNYEPRYWWFECFEYMRRLALTGLMVVIVPGSALQSFLGLVIALGGLVVYVYTNPFVEDMSDLLAIATQLSTFFVFLAALMLKVDVEDHKSWYKVVLFTTTLVPPVISLYFTCTGMYSDASTLVRGDASEPRTPNSKDTEPVSPEPSEKTAVAELHHEPRPRSPST
jgi:hypothetical protein